MAIQTDGRTLRIGIDVGGTKIAGVLLAEAENGMGQPEVLSEHAIPARPGAEPLVDDVMSVIAALADKAGAKTAELSELGTRFVGIGTPGKVDDVTGAVDNIANLGIAHVELGGEVARRSGLPVRVENDVNAAALGAAAMLPSTGASDADGATDDHAQDTVVFLNLGTGLAAGVIRGGKLDRGHSNVVGEIGHIPVEPHRWACPCGQRGCLETAGSGGAATRLWPQDNPPMPAIIAKAGDETALDHTQAIETLDTIVGAIADAIDIVALAIDPRSIIIGGGMAKTGRPLLDCIATELHRREQGSGFIASLHLADRLTLVDPSQPVGAIGAALAGRDARQAA